MDDRLFAVISTISGLIVGWTLNELSDLFRSKRENKKVLNQTLFIQLEIRTIILKTDLAAIEGQLKDVLAQRFPDDVTGHLQEITGKIFYAFIQNELNTKFSKKIQELIQEYKRNISSLSQIDPFTTYYISDKDILLDYLGYINNYLEKIEPYLGKPLLSDDPEISGQSVRTFKIAFDDIKEKITPLIRNSAVETIENDIRIVSKRINFFTYLRTKRFLMRKINNLDNTDIKNIESYLGDI